MRRILFILVLTPIFLLTSCSKDDCIDDVLGTYIGTESCSGSVYDGVITITSSSQEDQVVFAVSGTTLTWNAELSSDCGTLTVPSQNVSVNGLSGNIDGVFNINGNSLTGTLSFFGASTCSYNFTRQ